MDCCGTHFAQAPARREPGRSRRGTESMRGVILAAGRGARLNGGNGDMPKCLVTVGGETLLARNVRVLREAGIEDVVVVVGCAAETVRRSLADVTFVDNPQF